MKRRAKERGLVRYFEKAARLARVRPWAIVPAKDPGEVDRGVMAPPVKT